MAERPAPTAGEVGEVRGIVPPSDPKRDAVERVRRDLGDHARQYSYRFLGRMGGSAVSDLDEERGELHLRTVVGRLERYGHLRAARNLVQPAQRRGHPTRVGGGQNPWSAADLGVRAGISEGVHRKALDVLFAPVDGREDEGRVSAPQFGRKSKVDPFVVDVKARPAQEEGVGA